MMINFIQDVYEGWIRERLPKRVGMVSGVRCRMLGFFDLSEPGWGYERELIDVIRCTVSDGDSVVIVGGGRGLSTVWAGRLAGPTGEITVFEAVGEQAEMVRETAELNDLRAKLTVRECAVGKVNPWSADHFGAGTGDVIDPADLPTADVAILDCEGAETGIIPHLDTDRAVVESHGFLDSSTETVQKKLELAGYDVSVVTTEDADKDIRILRAEQRS